MNRIALGAGALLLISTSMAQAGALDRSGQPITALFEDGNYAELNFGFTTPDVEGTFPLNGASSGSVGTEFSITTLSFKYDINDRLSFAVIVDEPFGADVDYGDADPGYPIAGSFATFESTSVTALGRYKFNDRFSVHGGARLVRVDADLYLQSPNADGTALNFYEGDFDTDSDVGYVVGAAYERDEIGLRVALTYSSETNFSHGTDYVRGQVGGGSIPGSGLTEYTLPQSVNLDFRTGIAQDTAIFGSIRWVDWTATTINVPPFAPEFPGAPPNTVNPVVSHEEDIVTYTLGIGRRFTDQLTASAAVIYEPATASDFDPTVPGSGASNLAPSSGQLGIQLAATYAINENIELTGGLRYTRLGDVTTRGIGAEFTDNDAVSLGLRVGFRF
jgi:long-subunit fatty acid transport protein